MSLENNQYWNGETHAVLRRENITASWGSGDHSATRIDAANRAFCIYYYAKRSLDDSVTESHWTEMYEALNECAKSGWGSGVDDLQEALDHIDRNGGRWTDGDTANYYGGNGKSYKLGIITDMPDACATFLTAVDDKLPRLARAMEAYRTRVQAIERLRLTPESTTDWEQIKENIDGIKTAAERIKPILWLLPAVTTTFIPRFGPGTTAAARIEGFSEAATPRVNQAISFLDTVGNIHDAMTVYVDATRAFEGDRRMGVAFAALTYAMTFVPVLGTFYGTIIQKIPGLVVNWREFIEDYHRRRLHPELYLGRDTTPPSWRCEICNSSGGY